MVFLAKEVSGGEALHAGVKQRGSGERDLGLRNGI